MPGCLPCAFQTKCSMMRTYAHVARTTVFVCVHVCTHTWLHHKHTDMLMRASCEHTSTHKTTHVCITCLFVVFCKGSQKKRISSQKLYEPRWLTTKTFARAWLPHLCSSSACVCVCVCVCVCARVYIYTCKFVYACTCICGTLFSGTSALKNCVCVYVRVYEFTLPSTATIRVLTPMYIHCVRRSSHIGALETLL
jgi:hypothetical protein